MRFKDNFVSDFETSDNNIYSELRTRYYRCRSDKAIEAIKEMCKEEMLKITSVTSRNEVTVECPKYYAVITVCETVPLESAIDVKISTNHGILDFGRGPKYIKKIYDCLDKKLPFKGVSLFKGN